MCQRALRRGLARRGDHDRAAATSRRRRRRRSDAAASSRPVPRRAPTARSLRPSRGVAERTLASPRPRRGVAATRPHDVRASVRFVGRRVARNARRHLVDPATVLLRGPRERRARQRAPHKKRSRHLPPRLVREVPDVHAERRVAPRIHIHGSGYDIEIHRFALRHDRPAQATRAAAQFKHGGVPLHGVDSRVLVICARGIDRHDFESRRTVSVGASAQNKHRTTTSGAAAPRRATWIVRGDGSRRRRGCHADRPWRGNAAAPRRATWILRGDRSRRRRGVRRGSSAETGRGDAAAATRIVRGDESRRRRDEDVDSPWRRELCRARGQGRDRRRCRTRRRWSDRPLPASRLQQQRHVEFPAGRHLARPPRTSAGSRRPRQTSPRAACSPPRGRPAGPPASPPPRRSTGSCARLPRPPRNRCPRARRVSPPR